MTDLETKRADLLRAIDLLPTDLGAAHKIAQQHEGDPVADALHAIIHRREGDYSNSLYWWRRVPHAVTAQLHTVYPGGDPAEYVHMVTRASRAEANADNVERQELDVLRSILTA